MHAKRERERERERRKAMSSGVKVLTAWRSIFGVRVLIALKEKGVEYEYEEQDLANKSQLLLQSNPVHKKIPVLIHNGKPICESLIILQYIDETWPSHDDQGFLPQDPYKRALVRFWADFIDKKLFEACLLIFKNVEGESMEQGRNIIKESLVTLDEALQVVFSGGRYFGGDAINLVDIALASYIPTFETLETFGNFKVLDENACPCICAWVDRVAQYPSVKEGLATIPSQKFLESMRWVRKEFFNISE